MTHGQVRPPRLGRSCVSGFVSVSLQPFISNSMWPSSPSHGSCTSRVDGKLRNARRIPMLVRICRLPKEGTWTLKLLTKQRSNHPITLGQQPIFCGVILGVQVFVPGSSWLYIDLAQGKPGTLGTTFGFSSLLHRLFGFRWRRSLRRLATRRRKLGGRLQTCCGLVADLHFLWQNG